MKIKVIGKSQNRIALGIAHSYLKLYPQSTINDLVKAFPNSLNPDSGVKAIFIEKDKTNTVCNENWNGFFTKDNTVLKLQDGKEIVFVSMWTKKSFDNLIQKAKEYGITTEKLDKVTGLPDEGFILKDLRVSTKQSKNKYMYILLIFILLCLLIYFFIYG